jgi:predicted kinase
VLIVMSGRSGVGKTTIARAMARTAAAVYLRIDSIEQALVREGLTVAVEGYVAAYAVLALGVGASRGADSERRSRLF